MIDFFVDTANSYPAHEQIKERIRMALASVNCNRATLCLRFASWGANSTLARQLYGERTKNWRAPEF